MDRRRTFAGRTVTSWKWYSMTTRWDGHGRSQNSARIPNVRTSRRPDASAGPGERDGAKLHLRILSLWRHCALAQGAQGYQDGEGSELQGARQHVARTSVG